MTAPLQVLASHAGASIYAFAITPTGWFSRLSLVRRLRYGQGNRVMTYAERAREIAARGGFPRDKVVPIYNSLDWTVAKPLLDKLIGEGRPAVRQRVGIGENEYRIICVARLIPECRFDQLIDAVAMLDGGASPISICLIGAGPEREALEQRADEKGVRLILTGALYDEVALADQIFASDLTVSPGKVGLSAMHSMMYGTPVISHGDLDQQMPEVEAIVPGKTGDLFERDNVADLAAVISRWQQRAGEPRPSPDCLELIATKYNPVVQAERINAVVSDVTSASR